MQDYFSRYPVKGALLDLGCGQGRDSIFLASVGYQVTKVDSSKIGVKQMMGKAQSQGLNIDGIVSDADLCNCSLTELPSTLGFGHLIESL